MTGPTAAKGRFPYNHRTVAEMDALNARPARFGDGPVWCEQCDRRVSAPCASRFCTAARAA